MKEHILYSFRRCPYAMRARWALQICCIEMELREIDLKNKPLDLIQRSRSQTVPLLILKNGETIQESLDIVIWALNTSNPSKVNEFFGQKNRPAIMKIIEENDNSFKFHLDRFKYSSRYDQGKKYFHYKNCQKFINKWNEILAKNSLQENWLVGQNESIADWCIWPFVRQFKIACESQRIKDYFEKPIQEWLNYYIEHPSFSIVMHKYKTWNNTNIMVKFPVD